jgi:hypothetical protein
VQLFAIFSWCLLTILAATLVLPLNVAVLALAYRVSQGPKPVPMETGPFWMRSALGACGLFVLSLLTLVLIYAPVEGADLPAGPVHLVLVLAYVPAGVMVLHWVYALDDMFEAAGVFVLDVLLAGIPLLVAGRLSGLGSALARKAPWLMLPF